jgi:hypothetical protein
VGAGANDKKIEADGSLGYDEDKMASGKYPVEGNRMKREMCQQYLRRLTQLEGLPCGSAPSHVQAWLDTIGLPAELCALFTHDWILGDCKFGNDTLHAMATILRDKATSGFLPHSFINIGTTSDGDWLAIDFSTAACRGGLIPHDQDWNPWDDRHQSPRSLFWADSSLEDFFAERVEESESIWKRHEEAKTAAAPRGPLTCSSTFTYAEKCGIVAFKVPDGFLTKTSAHARETVSLSPHNNRGGMVVCTFSLQHRRVREAIEGRMNYRDFPVGRFVWRLSMPDPHSSDLDCFMAILVRRDEAVAVYASHLYWRESDLRNFLSGMDFRE